MKLSNRIILLLIFLIIFDGVVWAEIIFNKPNKNPELYFLNVGQGDSELVVLPGNIKVLIDGGPDNKVLGELSSIFPPFDRYVDLIILSHPQLDHFGGLIEILKRYGVGALIWSGIENNTASFKEFKKTVENNNVPEIILAENDRIKYQGNDFEILFPPKNLPPTKKLNDVALVIKFTSENKSALFAADIGKNIEKALIKKYDLKSDILKISHHGSKNSSAEEFLRNVSPKISVIEVGKNSYGHPTKEVLAKLSDIGSKIFRTDRNGTIKLTFNDNEINIFSRK